MASITAQEIELGRRDRAARWMLVVSILALLAIVLAILILVIGNNSYSLATIFRVLVGEEIAGASFAIRTLRLPRMLAAVLAGFAFGMSGSVFQTLLRNPLASPNIIGITSGSSAAAVFFILVLRTSGTAASAASVAAGLIVTALIYILSQGGGFSGGKLILIGIGIQAMLNALISYMLQQAASNDAPSAMRWLSGSLNAVKLTDIVPLGLTMILAVPLILLLSRSLSIMELGEQSALTLGVRTNLTRILIVIAAVCLLAFATVATGPIAFVSFLAGPIAKRLSGSSLPHTLPAGFIGAILVLAGDLIGQNAFAIRLPVGVITGIIGAPYLIYLLIRTYKIGEA
ncbi:MAG: iron chelate uptake ABC transporter family permease subunit [Clostridiaceae bacterium]|nr:iron chelate uptake ABC transporter family permease subunit [Clostridiaceae bacterium]